MKKAKRQLILYAVCSALLLACSGFYIYLAISFGKYLYFLPAASFAVASFANAINVVKCRKRIKSQ